MKAYFLIVEGWPGVATALRSVQKILKSQYPDIVIENIGFESGKLSFGTIRKLKQDPADILFLGGWDNNVKLLVHNAVNPETKIVLLWCSPIVQTDLGGEISRFMEVLDFVKSGYIDSLGILLDLDYEFLKGLSPSIKFMPIWMDTEELDGIKLIDLEDGYLHTDIFCAPCPRKNIFLQMLALLKYKEKIKLHVNYIPSPNTIEYINFGNKYFNDNFVNHLWMNRKVYLSHVKSMDIGLQVTLSESYNYTAGEHLFLGTPILLSKSTPISRNLSKDLDILLVDDYTNLSEVSRKIKNISAIEDKKELSELCSDSIMSYNLRQKEILLQNIINIIG